MYLKEECGLSCRSHLWSTHSSHCAPTGRRCTGGHLFGVVPGWVLGIWLAWNSSEACNGSPYRRNSAWTFTFSRGLQRFMVLFFIELSPKSRPLAPPFHLLLTRAGYLVNPATPAQWDASYRTFGRTPERYRFIRHRVFSVAPTGIEYPHRQSSLVGRWTAWQRQGRGRPSRSAGATAV